MSRVNGRSHESERSGGSGALERGHVALLEPLAQLGDALRGVGAHTTLGGDATKRICSETAMGTRAKVSVGTDTKANTMGRRRT